MTSDPRSPTPTPRLPRCTRRASAYVLVLGVAMLVLVIGVGAITAIQAEARGAADLGDIGAARLNAASGIQVGCQLIADDPDWRKTRVNGVWATDQPIGDGAFTLEVVNPAGVLDRAPTDSVVMTATGTSGRARHVLQVTLDPTPTALSCLGASLCAGGSISFTGTTVTAINQVIASNISVTALAATVNANVEAAQTIIGLTYKGATTAPAAPRRLPASTVFDYYIAHGTAISVGALSSGGGGGRTMSRAVLGPGINSLGGTANARGIYVLDAKGEDVTISDSRIVGTLVILNPGSGSSLEGSVNWSPAADGAPCLLVKGNFAFRTIASTLSESSSKVSFNPTGMPYPYPGGTSNATFTDSFPSVIDGLVYVSGNATSSNAPTIATLVVGGTFASSGALTLTYSAAAAQNPPPGFYESLVSPIPGTFAQVVK